MGKHDCTSRRGLNGWRPLKGLLSLILAVGLLGAPLAGCEEKKESTTPEEFLKKERAKRAEEAENKKAGGSAGETGETTGGSEGEGNNTVTMAGSEPGPGATTTPLGGAETAPAAGGGESGTTMAPSPDDPANATAAAQPTVRDMPEVKLAEELVRSGRYLAAIRKAKEALRKNEKHTPAMLAMAKAYYKLGKHEFTDSICDIALEIKPDIGECYNLKANIALKNDNDPLAMQHFKKAISVNSSLGTSHLNIGALYLKAKNYQSAQPALESAKALMPNDAKVHLNLGVAYRGSGKLIQAQASFNQALALKSGYAEAYYNLGVLFLDAPKFGQMDKLDQLNKAVEYFNQYKRNVRELPRGDLADQFIADAQKAYEREVKKRERDAKRASRNKARDAQKAAKAAEKAAADKAAADKAVADKAAADKAKAADPAPPAGGEQPPAGGDESGGDEAAPAPPAGGGETPQPGS